jgi:hypothetical protein
MPGYSVGVVETKCSYCPFLEAGGGLAKSWKRGNILRKGSVRMVGGMLSIGRREREGNNCTVLYCNCKNQNMKSFSDRRTYGMDVDVDEYCTVS